MSKKNYIYYDGQHKIKIFGIRSVDLSKVTSKYMYERMKRFIQVKIKFIDEYFWINIYRNELMKIR